MIGLLGSLNSPKLEMRRLGAFLADDGKALELLNVGTEPLTVLKMGINDRADCTVKRLSWTDDSSPFPGQLKVGDKLMVMSSCRVIRASVETDHGSNTYSFTGP